MNPELFKSLEIIAVIFSVASVLLAWKNHVLLYPTGMVGTLAFVLVMYEAGLFAESALNIYYFCMSSYGWFNWTSGRKSGQSLQISQTSRREWVIVSGIVGIGGLLIYAVLVRYTSSTVPILDSLISSFAWGGMWLLARRKIANWILLNISNAIAIPVQFSKNIPLTACLTLFLFIIACFGYYSWRKAYQKQIPAFSE